MYLIISYV